MSKQKNLKKFLRKLKKNGLFDRPNVDGKIIYVEDEFATCEQMKLQF